MKMVVECYHDTALARALGVPIRRIGHENGKGNVLRLLTKWDGDAVGVVDGDPGQEENYRREMAKYRERDAAHGLRRLTHSADARKTLVVVEPTLEVWLLARADVCKIELRTYGLPENARALHKSPRYDLKPGFRRFLGDLAASDVGMKTLKKWLTG